MNVLRWHEIMKDADRANLYLPASGDDEWWASLFPKHEAASKCDCGNLLTIEDRGQTCRQCRLEMHSRERG